jgi:hypothetical protein
MRLSNIKATDLYVGGNQFESQPIYRPYRIREIFLCPFNLARQVTCPQVLTILHRLHILFNALRPEELKRDVK